MQNLLPSSLVATSTPTETLWAPSPLSVPASNVSDDAEADLTAGGLTTATSETIHTTNATAWNRLIPRDEPQLRHDFLVAAEASGIMKQPRYTTVERNGTLVGVAVTYEADIDLFLMASPKTQRTMERVRRGPLRRLGVLRSRTCGPIITNCRPNLYLAPDLAEADRAKVAQELVSTVDDLPGGALRLFFEHPAASAQEVGSELQGLGYVEAASLPGTRLNVVWATFDEYVGEMRRIYRRAVRHDEERAQGLDIRIETDFAHLAEEAYALYVNVVERAQSVVGRLTPEFFRSIAACESARLVTAREKSTGRLVGIELLMIGEDTLQDLYTGVDYAVNAQYNLYFNLIYPGIALACARGLKIISTGQTSYEFKSRLGVEAFPLYVYFKHRNPLVNALLHRFHAVICPPTPTTTHNVFRGPDTTPSKKVTARNKKAATASELPVASATDSA